MNSLMLRRLAHEIFWPLLILSVVALYRGHNLPGGGFIGGLLAASPFVLVGLAEGLAAARQRLRVSPVMLIATGLALALGSGWLTPLAGQDFMTGGWLPTFTLPLLGAVHLGTPLIFDIGIYLSVVGFTLTVIFSLGEAE